MRRFRLSPEARNDLFDIWAYIAEDSIDSADRVREEFYQAFTKLAEFPGLGHSRNDLTDKPLRFWPVHSYLIVYRPDSRPIEIVRVLSGYRDIGGLLT